MGIGQKISKAVQLLRRPAFAKAVIRDGVAATIEHLDAIKLTAPSTVIDIGANKGQFSLAFLTLFPQGKAIAFEPFPTSARKLTDLFSGDQRLKLHQLALSDVAGEAEFFVADRQDSSSLLKPGEAQSEAYGVASASTISVPVKRLDQVIDPAELTAPVFMKVDVQGAELKVFQGCDWLEQVDFIYVEVSYVELYEGQPLFGEVSNYLFERGFAMRGIFEQSITDRFGPTQADVLFARASSLAQA